MLQHVLVAEPWSPGVSLQGSCACAQPGLSRSWPGSSSSAWYITPCP